jgi:hypothetical protein
VEYASLLARGKFLLYADNEHHLMLPWQFISSVQLERQGKLYLPEKLKWIRLRFKCLPSSYKGTDNQQYTKLENLSIRIKEKTTGMTETITAQRLL